MIPDRTIAPPTANAPHIAIPPCTSNEELSTGAVLHTLEAGDQPLARLTLIWEGGSLDSTRASLPLLMAECLREGSGSFSGAEIADAIDFCGARLSSRVAEHHTGIEILALSSKLGALLPLLKTVITDPLLEQEIIDMNARQMAGTLATRRSTMTYGASQAIVPILRGKDHPASREELPEHILTTTRTEVVDCYRNIIHQGRLHAFLSGKFTPQLAGQVREFVASLPSATDAGAIKIVPNSPEAPRKIYVDRPESLQSAVAMGMPTIGRDHPDYITLRLAVIALGGYFSSRLMQNIREEKGLTYGINASLLGSYEGGSVRIGAQCDARYVEQVIDETMAEIKGMSIKLLDSGELNRLKLNAWTSLASTTDSPFSIMDYYITAMQVGTGVDYFQRQLETISCLTPADIARVASLYLNADAFSIGVCGKN
ncbi:MAG: insulinase family protein [Odoribacter sp.]|nr:insulinase family protein [Odoribacter sp.]